MFDVRNHTRSCLPNGEYSLTLLSKLKHKQIGNVVLTKPKYIPFFTTTCLKKTKWKHLFANQQRPLLNFQIPGSLKDNVRTQKKETMYSRENINNLLERKIFVERSQKNQKFDFWGNLELRENKKQELFTDKL